jgi:hypothetical protein
MERKSKTLAQIRQVMIVKDVTKMEYKMPVKSKFRNKDPKGLKALINKECINKIIKEFIPIQEKMFTK